ncbi:XRE family transcriptional regulator [Pseudomonas psychrophila]|uniref:helix-turn-helix domain-containing protein n=1 Tax=Pseudomonas psychrophila TaxID=122355 RepID=UPI00062A3FDE|nr:XRE family transcriptional regulator [Pseudomonas psychrophila]KOX63827.1 XRE family transcriptional regulator [Pseudomonas psychrophila]
MSNTENFNPARLLMARQRRGWSKKYLADLSGLTSKTLSSYESSNSTPTEESLERLATALGFPVDFFSGDDVEAPTDQNASFRSFSRMTASQRDAALAAGGIAYLLSDWIDSKFNLPIASVPDCTGLDPEMAAEAVRAEWSLGQAPIKNMIHLLESKGVRVFSLAEETSQVNAFSCWRRGSTPFVFLNTKKSSESSRFDAAHELGHLVLHRHGENKGKEVESEANAFASALLMPKESILASGWRCRSTADIIEFKKIWNVSAMALAYRLHSTGILTEWLYRGICIDLSTRGARTREIDPAPKETSQILQKVFGILRDQGKSMRAIAEELKVGGDDLTPIIFGLTPLSISNTSILPPTAKKGALRLVQ